MLGILQPDLLDDWLGVPKVGFKLESVDGVASHPVQHLPF